MRTSPRADRMPPRAIGLWFERPFELPRRLVGSCLGRPGDDRDRVPRTGEQVTLTILRAGIAERAVFIDGFDPLGDDRSAELGTQPDDAGDQLPPARKMEEHTSELQSRPHLVCR